MATIDQNTHYTLRPRAVIKRSASSLAAKPSMGTRGLTLRTGATNGAGDQPPEKQQRIQVTTIVRPKNGPISNECELLTEDYVDDINEYLFDREEKHLVRVSFLSGKKVMEEMRSRLVDWIIQTHQKLHLRPNTLHLAVYIVDRYLEKGDVEEEQLQLVGACATLAAAKYEEVDCPEMEDLKEAIEGRDVPLNEMLEMEREVVRATGFDLGRPLSTHFLRSFWVKGDGDDLTYSLAKYFSEMCLMNSMFSSMKASLVAAGSLWLADHIKGSDLLLREAFSSVPDEKFMANAKETGEYIAHWVLRVRKAGNLKALYEKYSSARMHCVSNLTEEEEALLEEMLI